MSLTIQSGGSLTIQGGGGGGGGGATVGTYANRPAAGNAGAIYICTDSPIAQWVDDGSAWRPLIQGQALGTQVPAASAFTAFGSATLSDVIGTVDVSVPSVVANTAHGGTISLSSATAFAQATMAPIPSTGTTIAMIVGLRKASTGQSVAFAMYAPIIAASHPISCYAATFSADSRATFTTHQSCGVNAPVTGRVRRDGSNYYVEVSLGTGNWNQIAAYSSTDFGGAAPDQAMVGLMSGGNGAMKASLLSFKYGSL